MKRFIAATALTSLALAAFAPAAFAGPTEEITAKYIKIDPYFVKMDSPGLTRAFQAMCTPDFLNITQQGKQTLPEIMHLIADNFKTMKKVDSYKTTVNGIKFNGSKAEMRAFHTWVFETKDNHKISSTEFVTDIWLKQPAGWKLKSETTNNYKVIRDGKRLDAPRATPAPTAISKA